MKGRRFCLLVWVLALLGGLTLGSCHSSKGAAGKATAYEDPLYGGGGKGGKGKPAKAVPEKMARQLTREARKWIGTPYASGGHSRHGTDCSGMVMEVYRSVADVKLPRSSREMQHYCEPVRRSEASEGDLMFFSSNKSAAAISHVGLYIGNGQMIHASSSQGVMISSVDTGYWGKRYYGAGRVGAIATDKPSKASKEEKKDTKREKKRDKKGPQRAQPVEEPVEEPVEQPQLAQSVAEKSPVVQQVAEKPAKRPETVVPKAERTVSLYELTIDQKVDSICASFMD